MRLLLVEDSQRLREGLQTGLAGAGFAVDAAADGAAALTFLDAYDYPLTVLDLGLPKVDGMAVLARPASTDPGAGAVGPRPDR
jgi:DNA-binding response OmpR family regulator